MPSSMRIQPSRLQGCVQAPPSKSAAHRALLCGALSVLSGGHSCLVGPIAASMDMQATAEAVRAVGISVSRKENSLLLEPAGLPQAETLAAGFFAPGQKREPGGEREVNCLESGSTLRFLIPIFAALGIPARFTGTGRLPERPIGVYEELLPRHGVICRTNGGLPFSISGQLCPGVYTLPGNISSQFVTGLLLALPLLEGNSKIVLTTPLESAAYVDMTLEVMEQFGVSVHSLPDRKGWQIPGRQRYSASRCTVEGDWSQAAFFLAAGALGGDVRVSGLRPDSLQGDRRIVSLLREFGADIVQEESPDGTVYRALPGLLKGISIDASQIPDLVPVLAAVACFAEGSTQIHHAQRLRLKESDRLSAMAKGITALGGWVTEFPDGLLIKGVPALTGGTAYGRNDHRVVMALAMAALKASGESRITDPESIRKSYPDFWERYTELGGKAHVCSFVSMGE